VGWCISAGLLRAIERPEGRRPPAAAGPRRGRRRFLKRRVAGAIAVAAWSAVLAAQAPPAAPAEPSSAGGFSVRIVSPGPDTYVSGLMTLKAVFEPGPRAKELKNVRFFANSRQVCAVADPVRAECEWDAGEDVKEHLIRVVADVPGGERIVAVTRTKPLEHYVEKVAVDVVQITAVVQDGNRFIKGLPRTAFRLLEDGVPQTITHFTSEGSALEIAIMLDVSQSMTLAMPQLKNSVKRFLAALGPKDQVTIGAFNDNLYTLTKRETTRARQLTAIDRLQPWGGTALYDTIVHGVRQLSRQPGRRVLVVFSDGDDRTSHATIKNVEDAVRSTDTTLFMVALGRGVKEVQLKTGIQRLVDLSGGRVHFVERSDRLDEPFQDIIEELSNQYLIGFQSTNSKHDGAWRELRLEVPGTGHDVRARQGYRAPSGS
jgi:Ca-activated chloride channel family protein